MYKFYTNRFGTDAVSRIKELRKEFPGCSFATGIRKDKKGIFAFASNEIKEYGDSWELTNGDIFFAPTPERLEEIRNNLDKYKSEWQERIPVTLLNGKVLSIYPASALPRKVFFTRKVETKVNKDNPYDPTLPYGKLAYDLFNRTQKDDKIMLDDQMMIDFVKMALSHSYTLPEPLWDALELVSFGDFDKIFAAAMGMDWDYLQEEVKKSNVASQQMTGANAT